MPELGPPPQPGQAGPPPPPPPFRGALPILGQAAQPGVGIARSTDRRITFAGLVVSAGYLAVAAAALLLPPAIRLGAWLPVHLVLAGAAATAIAAVLPFFTAALVVAPPARPAIRVAAIGLVAVGAAAVMTVFGHAAGEPLPATLAGGTFLGGIGLVGVAAFGPLRAALGPRRVLVERAYAVALLNVAVGATIATFLLGGNDTVGAAWGFLKPAHAWLNLVGFVGLVVAASLIHLAPTIVGTRMRPRLSGRVAIAGLAVGAPIVAAGYALQLDLVARGGAIAVLVGAAGLVGHGLAVQGDGVPGRWTTDAGWHRLTAGALVAGQAWLGLGLGIAGGRVLFEGASPSAWSLAGVIGPLLVGGVVQVLLGAMTHLLPAIGPGDPIRHAAQRRLLGRGALGRLLALNAGALLLTLGTYLPTQAPLATPAGLGLAGVAVVSSVGLLALAARRGIGEAGATRRGPDPAP